MRSLPTGTQRRTSPIDIEIDRSGHPADVCMDENVRYVSDMITTDWQLTVRYVAACLKLSYGTSHHAGLQQNVCSMGAANADAGEKASLSGHFTLQSQSVQRRSSEVSSQICHHGPDLGSPLRCRDQAAEQAVEACHFADASKVSQDCL